MQAQCLCMQAGEVGAVQTIQQQSIQLRATACHWPLCQHLPHTIQLKCHGLNPDLSVESCLQSRYISSIRLTEFRVHSQSLLIFPSLISRIIENRG